APVVGGTVSSARMELARSRDASVLRVPHEARGDALVVSARSLTTASQRRLYCLATNDSHTLVSKSGLELVRELDVVNDNAVVGRFIDERADVWLPRAKLTSCLQGSGSVSPLSR